MRQVQVLLVVIVGVAALLLSTALFLAVAVAGCGGNAASVASPSPLPSAYASAEAALHDYYALVSDGQFARANTLIAPDERADLAVDQSLIGLTDLHFKPLYTGKEEIAVGGPARWSKYADMCEFQVSYVTHATDPIGDPPGKAKRFAILGRLPSRTQWLLVGYPGTGR